MKSKLKMLFMAILFFIGIMIFTKVDAANASISANKTTVTVGENVTITVKFTAASWDLVVSGAGVSGHYTDTTDDAKNKTSTKTLTLDTSSAGTKTISLVGTVSDGDTDATSKVNTSVTITVNSKTNSNSGSSTSTNKPQQQKGTVSSCYINGYKISEYLTVTNKDSVSVKVNTSTGEGLKIYNSLTKKTISASSGKEVTVPIVEGTNTLTITLNSGNSVTRKIYSQKEEEVEANQIEDETKEEVKVVLKSLGINTIETETEEGTNFKLTPEFSSEIYEYSIIIPEEYNDITKLDIKAIGEQDDFIIEITGNENLVDGENIVTILVKSKDGEKIATYKIIVNKTPKAIEAVTEPLEEVAQVIEEDNEEIKITKIVIVVFTVILTIAGIIFAVIEYMYGKKHNEENDFGEIPYANIEFKKEDEEEEGNVTFVKEEKRKGKHF